MEKLSLALFISLFIIGCASVPMESEEQNAKAKLFNSPPTGKSGVYIYRPSSFGASLKKDIWLDNQCIGESAPYVFFYAEVAGNAEHTLSTESEFSPNDLKITPEPGKNYFIKQYIKPGVFVGGAGLEKVDEAEGKSEILELDLAKRGFCSK